MEVYKVTESQIRGWIRGPWDQDARYKFSAGLNDYPMSGDFVIVGCSSWFGSFDTSDDGDRIIFGNIAIVDTLGRSKRLVDAAYERKMDALLKGYSEYAMEWEIWAVVDDDEYDHPTDDDDGRPCHNVEVAFVDMESVIDYVCTAIGDEYLYDFDVRAIARSLVTYDNRCHHFLVKPIYQGYHVNQITNDNFWNLVHSFDKRRSYDWIDFS